MRWAILAASVAAASLTAGLTASAAAQDNKPEGAATVQHAVVDDSAPPAQQLLVTSPPNAAPDRTYPNIGDALKEADIDYIVRQARHNLATGQANDQVALWTLAAFTDDFAAGRLAEARTVLTNAPGGLQGSLADMLEPFLLAAEGHVDRGVERVDSGGDNLPAPLPELERGLVFESAGRLQEAAAVYTQMVEHLDTTPPGDSEPRNVEEFQRALGATRTAHAIYRAALVSHRLHRTEEARRYYNLVLGFAPRSIDVVENLRRLDAGQDPIEPALDAKRAAGRWMIFLSEFLTQTESLAAVLASRDPSPGFSSTTGAALLQIGLLLAPDANDWRLYAAQQVLEAGGNDGAQRIIDQTPQDSVFYADAEVMRASILLDRHDEAGAVASADRALAQASDRWPVIAAVGDVYRRANRPQQAVAAYDRALTMVTSAEDRADILGYRAYANRFAGNLSAATSDMRAAYALDQSVDTRLLYVSILMDDPAAWRDGVNVARGLFAEQPDSVLRLNALGYALIQHPEGLEEGYRLLWRGFNFGQQDYSVIDSLGWAYYQYGHFDDARALVERANQLSVANPNFEILDHLGDIYWRLNRRDDARTQWRAALDAHPDAPRRRSIEGKIAHGMSASAPRTRDLPHVDLPEAPAQRNDL
jgi:tetratricopeptide (TPR) repeat protein